ncbi:MAG: hypothetical protein M9909_02095 [Thermomicrobiales bacterium]|nr:hypothetical protein [Thermomicrobiales bacterium]
MTDTESSSLFEYALSDRSPVNEDEEILMELHTALGISRPPATLLRFPTAKRQPDWQRYLYAAVAAALIVAMIGASFRYLTTDPGPGGDDVASVPPVVLGLASPETTSACNGTRSIPVIIGATSAPEGIAAIVMTPDGDLILDCEGRQDVLATGVQTVYALAWPGVVFLVSTDNSSRYLNVFTGVTFDVQLSEPFTSPRSTLGLLTNRNSGRLEVIPATGNPGAAAILDLETFTELPLFDHRGAPLQVTQISALTANYRGDCIALAYSNHVAVQNTDYLDGFLRVSVDGSTVAMPVAESLQPVPRELAISPDCDTVASVAFQGEPAMGTTKVTIQSFAETDAIATYSAETPDILTRITWLKSGDGLVFGAGNALYWTAPFDTTEPVSLKDDVMVDTVMLTRDPNVVAISIVDWNAGPDQNAEGTLIFNTATRETMTLDSADVYPSTRLLPAERNTLIMRTSPVQIYDAATGDHLGDVGDTTTDPQMTIVAEVDPYGSAEIGLVGSSLDDLWRILDSSGEPMMEKIDPPTGLEVDGMPIVAMSHDGWVYLTGSPPATNGWLKNLDDPAADWVEVTFASDSSARVQFLQRGEQQVAPEATPVTTQATCDLSADFPLILYANDFPVDATTLILNDDGDLVFRCAGSTVTTVIATNVVAVSQTGLPSTIAVSTANEQSWESINGIPASSTLTNLQTGDRVDMGVGSLSMQRQQAHSGPWHLMTADNDSLTPVVVDLRTLQTYPLQSQAPEEPALITMATSSNDGDITAIVTLRDKYSMSLRSSDIVDESAPLEILIVGQTWDDHTTFSIDDIGGRASGISMSPDGKYLTIEVLDSIGIDGNNEPTQLLVIDTSTGEIVARTDANENSAITDPVWTADSSRVVYLNGTSLMVLEPGVATSPREVFTGESSLSILTLTTDPNVVLVLVGTTDDGATYHRVHLHTGTSELLGEQGWEVGIPGFERYSPIISLSNGETITWQNSATGENLAESTLTVTPEAYSGLNAVNLYFESPILAGAISDASTIWVWADDLEIRAVEAPESPVEIANLPVETTPDGRYIIVSETPQGLRLNEEPILPKTLYIMDTMAEKPEWIPVQAETSATPVANQARCDLTQDMPLITGVNESPIESTAVLLTPDGELVLTCNGTRELLLEDVTEVKSGSYPGVILVESSTGTGFYNLILRQMFTLSDPAFVNSSVQMQANALRTPGRWWIVPSSDDSSRASLLDLRTFSETHLVSDSGDRLLLDSIAIVASNYDEDTVIVAISYYRPDLRSTFLRGYAVIVDGEQVGFQGEQSTLPVPRELAVSPDGAHYAAATYQGDQNSGAATIEVFTRGTASPIKTISLTTPNSLTHLTWLKSGDGLVYTDSSNVYLLPAPYATSDPEVLLESENVTTIALTRDPDIVTVTSFLPAQVVGSPPETAIVNTRTGEVTALEGVDMFLPSYLQPVERNVLLLQTSMVVRQDGDNAVRVHDATTGELLGEIERPVQVSGGFSSSQYGYGRGEIGVVAFNADSIWLLLDDGQPVLTRIPAPESIPTTASMSIRMSEDGWLFTWTSGPVSYGWLKAPGSSDWIEVRFTGDIESSGVEFVMGSQ